MLLGHYLGLLLNSERALAAAYRKVGTAHADEADVQTLTTRLAGQCEEHVRALEPIAARYPTEPADAPEGLLSELFGGVREGGLGLLRDLQDLYLMAVETEICWTMVTQAASGARDEDLIALAQARSAQTAQAVSWLRTRMKQAAPQALVVA
jgi:hypothetical protein